MLRLPVAVCLVAVLGSAAAAHAQMPGGLATTEMQACAALGAKRPGTAAGLAMADRLARRFKGAGLQTRFEDFHLPLYQVKEERIEVLDENPRRVPGETFAY